MKQRPAEQPIALLAKDVELLLELVPELRGRAATLARELLPGALTLVVPNPARRYRWLTGNSPYTIGVRVPDLPNATADVLEAVGVVAATSANLPGEPAPQRLEEIPEQLLGGAAVVVDGGELPGVASTVIDCTGPEPHIVREGAAPAGEALERLRAVTA
jgi:L-threonylcarbamoyladenylate synthase